MRMIFLLTVEVWLSQLMVFFGQVWLVAVACRIRLRVSVSSVLHAAEVYPTQTTSCIDLASRALEECL